MFYTTFIRTCSCGTRLPSANIVIGASSHRSIYLLSFSSSFSWSFSSFNFCGYHGRLILILIKLFGGLRRIHWWFVVSSGFLFLKRFHFFFMLFELSHFFCFFLRPFGKLLLKFYRVEWLTWLFLNHHLLLRCSLCHFRSTLRPSHLQLRLLMNLFQLCQPLF